MVKQCRLPPSQPAAFRLPSRSHPAWDGRASNVIGRIVKLKLYKDDDAGVPLQVLAVNLPLTLGQCATLKSLPRGERTQEFRRMLRAHQLEEQEQQGAGTASSSKELEEF